ncbi:MAG: phosphoribosylformylglycinamidine synthase I [Bacillota bacterium]
MTAKPRVCILRTDGTNCDRETFYAFELAGAECRLVHVNQLRMGREKLTDYQILVIPGGFSYGDDVHSGKILAVELTSYLKEQLQSFVDAGKPVLGICNGFQVLVRTGLLPHGQMGRIDAALMHNDSGHFECRWVRLRVEKSPCIFTRELEGQIIDIQVAHGEGKFFARPETLARLEQQEQVVFRYVDASGQPTQQYPANPNGSPGAIAGICDPRGLVLGLMPHPERCVEVYQHPLWRRSAALPLPCRQIFASAVRYVQS